LVKKVVLKPEDNFGAAGEGCERAVALLEVRHDPGLSRVAEGREVTRSHGPQLVERERGRHRTLVQHIVPGEHVAFEPRLTDLDRFAVGDVQSAGHADLTDHYGRRLRAENRANPPG
jgi:hypothetical protein